MSEVKVSESKEEVKVFEEDIGLDDEPEMIIFVSKEGKKFEIEKKAACLSKLVKTALDGDTTASEVPVQEVSSKILAYIIEYLQILDESLKGDRNEENKNNFIARSPLTTTDISDWENDKNEKLPKEHMLFFKKMREDPKITREVLLAANYMDIEPLLKGMCAIIAANIKGKSIDEIKQILSTNAKVSDDDEEVKDEDAPMASSSKN